MSPALALGELEFRLLCRLAHQETGIWLGESKRVLLEARLRPRLRTLGLRSFRGYYQLLQSRRHGAQELQQFVNAITTQTTALFREAAHFDFVAHTLVPAWSWQRRQGGRARIRCWSAACSTGEEAYSLAAVLHAGLAESARFDVKILATDISTRALVRAAAGRYPLSALETVPRVFRGGFIVSGVREAKHLQVSSPLRAMVVWRPLNLLAEHFPFKGRFDLILCRNVFIYFDEGTRRRLVEKLAGCLVPGGYLMLGLAEALLQVPASLLPLGESIYRCVRPEARAEAAARVPSGLAGV